MRVNYRIHNYCADCDIRSPKTMLRCPNCGQGMRYTPRNEIMLEEDVKRY